MDDDGLPEKKQLETLLKYGKQGYHVLNALVVNKDDHSTLAFGKMQSLTDIKEEITDKIFDPFNGTFIHRSVIEKIGYIKREMFIWGDEQEYRNRMIANGYKLYTITDAVHYHPREKGNKLKVFPFTKYLQILDKPEHLSHIYYRNLGYINKAYARHWYTSLSCAGRHIIAFAWRLRFGEIAKFVKWYRKGRNNDFD